MFVIEKNLGGWNMKNKFEIDLELLRKAKEYGRCLCKLNQSCPCEDFLEDGVCLCQVYKEIKDGN